MIDLVAPGSLAARPAVSLPYGRWLVLAVLLAAELLSLSIRFDSATLPSDDRASWGRLLGWAPIAFRAAIASAGVTLLLCGAGLFRELRGRADQLRWRRGGWVFVVGNLIAFAAVALLTRAIFEGAALSTDLSGLAVAGWVLAGLATLTFWAAAVVPVAMWSAGMRRVRRPLLVALPVSCGAVAAGQWSAGLWNQFGHSTFAAVHWLLGFLPAEIDYRPEGRIIGTSSFLVRIAPECSGYEGIGLLWCVLLAYFYLERRSLRFPHVLALLPLGTALMWTANVVRITALIAVGTWVSPQVALGGFHSQMGWLALNGVALGLMLLARRARWFSSSLICNGTETGANPVAAYLGPLMAIIATMMITGAVSVGNIDALYPLRIIAAGGVLWIYRREYEQPLRGWSWTAVGLGLAAFAIWMTLESLHSDPATAPASSDPTDLPRAWAAFWLAFRVVGSVLVVPLAEELAFRGYLSRRLIARDFQDVPLGTFNWMSFLLSSTLFGALHGRWLAATLAGMLYALALHRRGRLCDAILAHATTNALIAAYAISTRSWQLWA